MVANLQVFKITIESDHFDNLITTRNGGHRIDDPVLFNAGNLSGDLHLPADRTIGKKPRRAYRFL